MLTFTGEGRYYLQYHLDNKVVVNGWGNDAELTEMIKLVVEIIGIMEKKILLGATIGYFGSAENRLNINNYMNSTNNMTDAISRSFKVQDTLPLYVISFSSRGLTPFKKKLLNLELVTTAVHNPNQQYGPRVCHHQMY